MFSGKKQESWGGMWELVGLHFSGDLNVAHLFGFSCKLGMGWGIKLLKCWKKTVFALWLSVLIEKVCGFLQSKWSTHQDTLNCECVKRFRHCGPVVLCVRNFGLWAQNTTISLVANSLQIDWQKCWCCLYDRVVVILDRSNDSALIHIWWCRVDFWEKQLEQASPGFSFWLTGRKCVTCNCNNDKTCLPALLSFKRVGPEIYLPVSWLHSKMHRLET